MKKINIDVFIYSIGLAIFLVGISMLLDFSPQAIKFSISFTFTLLGCFLLVIAFKIKDNGKDGEK